MNPILENLHRVAERQKCKILNRSFVLINAKPYHAVEDSKIVYCTEVPENVITTLVIDRVKELFFPFEEYAIHPPFQGRDKAPEKSILVHFVPYSKNGQMFDVPTTLILVPKK